MLLPLILFSRQTYRVGIRSRVSLTQGKPSGVVILGPGS
jgi:hypothetical protein